MNATQRAVLVSLATGYLVVERLYAEATATKDDQQEPVSVEVLKWLTKKPHSYIEEAKREDVGFCECDITYRLTDKGRQFACRELGIVVKEGLAWEK